MRETMLVTMMNSDEYHHASMDLDDMGVTRIQTCLYCGLPWGDHARFCEMTPPDDHDDPIIRGREEDRTYQDLREREVYGP